MQSYKGDKYEYVLGRMPPDPYYIRHQTNLFVLIQLLSTLSILCSLSVDAPNTDEFLKKALVLFR
jgi:hypothetical protein